MNECGNHEDKDTHYRGQQVVGICLVKPAKGKKMGPGNDGEETNHFLWTVEQCPKYERKIHHLGEIQVQA